MNYLVPGRPAFGACDADVSLAGYGSTRQACTNARSTDLSHVKRATMLTSCIVVASECGAQQRGAP